jgi:hypothetical protein
MLPFVYGVITNCIELASYHPRDHWNISSRRRKAGSTLQAWYFVRDEEKREVKHDDYCCVVFKMPSSAAQSMGDSPDEARHGSFFIWTSQYSDWRGDRKFSDFRSI